ncbi:MAG: chromosome partitioning protein ParB [Legionellales bacterium]|nr:chromosome partitioning protein ParB [Legionellales bacterium]
MAKPELKTIPLDKLARGQYQPRQDFDGEALQELADSIKSSGLIQPIVVRPGIKDSYEIVAGERRWRAAQLAGLQDVPCLINHYTDEQTAAVTTIENINRVDLNPIEEAQAYQRLIDEFDYLHEEVAAVVGKSRTKVSNCLRLLKLDKRVRDFLVQRAISEGHGKVLAGIAENQQYDVAQKCVQRGWSVRKLDQEIKRLSQPTIALQHKDDVDVLALENLMAEQLGAKVHIDQDLAKGSGWLKIKYFDNDTLAGLLDRIGVKYDLEEH